MQKFREARQHQHSEAVAAATADAEAALEVAESELAARTELTEALRQLTVKPHVISAIYTYESAISYM